MYKSMIRAYEYFYILYIMPFIVYRCGEIALLRMSTSSKQFCHVKFANEEPVDGAILLSGMHIFTFRQTFAERFVKSLLVNTLDVWIVGECVLYN